MLALGKMNLVSCLYLSGHSTDKYDLKEHEGVIQYQSKTLPSQELNQDPKLCQVCQKLNQVLIGIKLHPHILSDHNCPLNIAMSPFININHHVDMCTHEMKAKKAD